MHKHLMKRSVTAALVAGGLLGLGAQPAQADGILFPYLSTQAGVLSFVSVINNNTAAPAQPAYQFTYGHKSASPLSNTANCAHFNSGVTATQFDMMTFHVGGTITTPGANGFALFEENNDALGIGTGQLTSQPAPLFALGQLAFLAVEHIVEPGGVRMELFGSAEVIDTGTNLSFAYSTNNFARTTGIAGATIWDAAGGIASGAVVLSWYPTNLVDSKWHILNLGTTAQMAPAAVSSTRRGYSVAAVTAAGGVGVNGAYNRDENFFSGAKETRIRCFGIVRRDDLLSGGPLAATAGQGGWTHLVGAAIAATPVITDDPTGIYAVATNYLVHKIQTVTPATGIAPRQLIDREANQDPSYTP
jgi:hypothetical protein